MSTNWIYEKRYNRVVQNPIKEEKMPSITRDQVKVPVDVSPEMREVYIDN